MKKTANESDITFLDGFDFLDEMDLEAEIDFTDDSHANISGAAKYTEWLSRYLKSHYDLPDRRRDSSYADWDLAYELWIKKAIETLQSVIDRIPEELRIEIQENMQ